MCSSGILFMGWEGPDPEQPIQCFSCCWSTFYINQGHTFFNAYLTQKMSDPVYFNQISFADKIDAAVICGCTIASAQHHIEIRYEYGNTQHTQMRWEALLRCAMYSVRCYMRQKPYIGYYDVLHMQSCMDCMKYMTTHYTGQRWSRLK